MPESTNATSPATAPSDGASVAFCSFTDLPNAIHAAGLPVPDTFLHRRSLAARHESHDGFDFFAVGGRNHTASSERKQFAVFFDAAHIVIAHDGHADIAQLQQALDAGTVPHDPGSVFVTLFDTILSDEGDKLDKIENTLVALESQVMVDHPDDCTAEIMGLRKRLLGLSRYYGTLYGIVQGLEDNRNGFLQGPTPRSLRLQAGRIDRLTAGVRNLQDYVAQVREAYQNQLDINLNQIMRLFTVITAIFMPLTLITGWYGMNLLMPELALPWMYPVVIAVSVVVVIVLLIWFKKKRWF